MGRLFREDFDRERDFVALHGFTFSGRGYVPGQPIFKQDFTVRRLRQMYDLRRIGYEAEYLKNLGTAPANGHTVPVKPEPAPVTVTAPVGGNIPRRRLSNVGQRRQAS